MRWSWLNVILLIAAGCQSAGKKKDTSPAADEKPLAKSTHWLDDVKPDWAKGDVPKAGSWSDPRDPKFDYTSSVKGTIAGYVLDGSDRPAPKAIIAVESASPSAKIKPTTVLVDQAGSFAIHGLIPGETYSLTAKMRDGSTMFVGQTHATPPSVHVRIRLKEEMNLPNAPGFGQIDGKTPIASKSPMGPPPEPVGDLPPLPGPAPIERDRAIPPPSADRRGPGDGGWSPVRPIGDPNELPMPTRPEQTAVAPAPAPTWTPPTAELPGRTPPAAPTIPTPVTPPPTVARKRSLALTDASGRSLTVPNGLQGELLLLDFMTSTCLPCKKAIPELINFQRRYGANGVEIVGVLCDNASENERRSLAARYVKEFNLNYLIHTEAKPGEVQKQFSVKGYPTLVLLDANGEVLWTGHPKDMAQLEETVRTALSRR